MAPCEADDTRPHIWRTRPWDNALRRLPFFHSLSNHVIAELNLQHTLADVEADHVAVAHGGDRAAQRGFRRDVSRPSIRGSRR